MNDFVRKLTHYPSISLKTSGVYFAIVGQSNVGCTSTHPSLNCEMMK